ncbi:MAG: hypothetical protein ACYS5V_07600 [Planctomycetota bacterium]|jgi:hypothetical protein
MGDETTKDEVPGPHRPDGPFWEDPVYRYVSGRHRSALTAADGPEAARFDCFMQQLVDGSMAEEVYRQLEAETTAERKRQKLRRKRGRPRPPAGVPMDDPVPSVNVADLKRRIFNPHVSRENVIKALEALPSAERKATIASLPPGLRRKLGEYLRGKGY